MNFEKEPKEQEIHEETASEAGLTEWEEPTEENHSMGFGKMLLGVIAFPGKMYQALAQKPMILWPLVIGAVITFIVTLPTRSLMEHYTWQVLQAQMATTGQTYPPDVIEKQIKGGYFAALVFAPIAVMVTPLIKGVICQGLAHTFDGKGTMKQSLSIVSMAYLIIIFGEVVRAPLSLASNTMLTFSPAILLPSTAVGGALYSLLSLLDVFTLWYLGVAAVGFKVVHRLTWSKAILVSVIPFALMLLLQGGSAAITVMMR